MKQHTYGKLTQMTKMGFVNAYFFEEEDGLTMIDSGIAKSGKEYQEIAQSLGKPIVRLLFTHAHIDHVGSLDELKALNPEAPVIFGERESRLLSKKDFTLDSDEVQSEIRGGFPIIQTVPDLVINEGDRVGSLEAIFTPGHTPGHLAFFDRQDGTLIGGDSFSSIARLQVTGHMLLRFPLPGMATWSLETALKSAKKMLALKPTRLALGHGRVIENPQALMQDAITRGELYLSKKQRKIHRA